MPNCIAHDARGGLTHVCIALHVLAKAGRHKGGFGCYERLWQLQVALAAASGFGCYEWLLQPQVTFQLQGLLQPQVALVAASSFGCCK